MIKRRKIYIFIFAFLLIISFLISARKFDKFIEDVNTSNLLYMEKCISYNNNYPNDDVKETCGNYINGNIKVSYNFYDVYSEIIYNNSFLSYVFPWLFIIIITSYFLSSIFYNNVYENYLTRMSYKDFRKKLFFESYKIVYIVLMVHSLVILYCFFKSHDFDFFLEQKVGNYSIFSFNLFSITVTILNSLTCCNISLMISRMKKNFLISSTLSYIAFIFTDLFFEIFFTMIISNIFNISDYSPFFNILGIFIIDINAKFYVILLVPIISFIVTFILTWLIFLNEEKIMYNNID